MINQFSVSVRQEGDVAVLSTDGYVNHAGGEKVSEAAREMIARGVHKLVINLEGSTVVNSIGISILIEIIEKIQDLEGAIAFCGMTRTIAKTFTIMGLGQFARMAESEQDAISAVT